MVDEGGPLTAELPESAAEWLDEQADASDVTREEMLRRLIAVVSAVDGDGAAPPTEADLEALSNRVATLEGDLDEKIQDVRERVVQLKREIDARAPADHDHPDLAEELRVAAAAADATQSRVDDLDEDVRALRETTERGFDNYEEILEHLTETADALEEKLTRVATVLVATRRSVERLGDAEADRRAVDAIKTEANRHGITAADCEHCGKRVDISLLTDPTCPHCEMSVRGVEPASGFFGSATLLEGEPAVEESVVDDALSPVGSADGDVAEALLAGEAPGEGSDPDADDGDGPWTATDGCGTDFVWCGDLDE